MHVVRIHPNANEGVPFWVEDDHGFNGGADDLADLLAMITEYVAADSNIDEWRADLVADQHSSSGVQRSIQGRRRRSGIGA